MGKHALECDGPELINGGDRRRSAWPRVRQRVTVGTARLAREARCAVSQLCDVVDGWAVKDVLDKHIRSCSIQRQLSHVSNHDALVHLTGRGGVECTSRDVLIKRWLRGRWWPTVALNEVAAHSQPVDHGFNSRAEKSYSGAGSRAGLLTRTALAREPGA